MWQYLYGKTAQLITSACLLVLLGAIWYLAIAPERAIALDSSERIDSERLTIKRMEAELAKSDGVMARYNNNLKEISRFRNGFLENMDERLVRISAFLEERTRARNIDKDTIEYNTSRGRDRDLEIYHIDLPLTGRYRDIRALVGDIEASDLYLIITELNLDEATRASGAVNVELSLATYFRGAGHE
jgi:hypothetical protein